LVQPGIAPDYFPHSALCGLSVIEKHSFLSFTFGELRESMQGKLVRDDREWVENSTPRPEGRGGGYQAAET